MTIDTAKQIFSHFQSCRCGRIHFGSKNLPRIKEGYLENYDQKLSKIVPIYETARFSFIKLSFQTLIKSALTLDAISLPNQFQLGSSSFLHCLNLSNLTQYYFNCLL